MKGSDIQVYVKTVTKSKKALCLLYKDSRYDMEELDKRYGEMNWQNSFRTVGDMLVCTISVWDEEKQQWISKENVGSATQIEKEKGHASDAFKRASSTWGIGRELYNSPDIFIQLNNEEIDNNGRCKAKFYVSSIKFTKSSVQSVVIKDFRDKVRFEFPQDANKYLEPETEDLKQVAIDKVKKTSLFTPDQKEKILSGIDRYPEKEIRRLVEDVLKGE